MATHNPKEARSSAEKTLHYIYRGDGHEHSVQPGDVVHIGGNLFTPSPFQGDDVNLDQMVAEFNAQAALHKGKGSKLFKHYVLSLAPGEILNESQWIEFATNYMKNLGFNNTTKWTAAIHRDTMRNWQHVGHVHYDEELGKYFGHDPDGNIVEVTGSEHLHIMACLVKNEFGGPLVSTSNDYAKGWDTMRHFEHKFGLRQLENPDENFGFNYTKAQLKAYGSREKAARNDEAAIIRARFKNLYEQDGKPRTITDLVVGLAKRDVHISVSVDKDNKPIGIAYKVGESGTYISGCRVKSTRFTWGKLISKEKIDYNPARDNPILGLSNGPASFTMSVKITKTQFKRLKTKHAPYRVRSIDNEAWVDFTFCRSRQERDLLKLMMNILAILKALFGVDETSLELKRLHDEALMRNYMERLDADQEAQQCYYEPTHLVDYDTFETSQAMIKIERDTATWRDPKGGGDFGDLIMTPIF
ncbi:relaxase/mobilization nuclease domain-containing protein [Photobacterium lipolyticum]|uniref:MobA/VirD2-like nuclease domain-containing protein n=1 Tax=Photobacterium lipolyticum TaxID=266810 RepID=A0A2T3N324_9GAMM|nr:hypothetical protein [Photobacterium lipolyticum]PSW06773.1 hypothetical protein C9I89_04395 [Photobacterium lipolyticum]